MNIKLPPEQEQWLNARVVDGEFASPEAAVQQMIADRMALESDDFVRVRMGVGPEHPVEDRASYVLGRFRGNDLETVASVLDQASEAVRVILREGSHKAMNRFNRRVQTPSS